MYKNLCLSVLVSSALLSSTALCFAQDEIGNNQPVRGPLNKSEARIQAKLTTDFNRGLLDATQLASFQRDFDGILDHENELKTGNGMNKAGEEDIFKRLAAFEIRLDQQAGINRTPKKHK
jgi:hypothetical protein